MSIKQPKNLIDIYTQYISETVDAPKSPDERRFVSKHVIQRKKHPVEVKDDADPEDMDLEQDRSRPLDYKDGRDKLVYESIEKNIKLNDGTEITLDDKELSSLKNMFNEMPKSSEKVMMKRLLKNKKSFNEILAFAKEAV